MKIIYHTENWLVAAALRSSDPNFRQSADCQKLGHWNQKISHGNGPSKTNLEAVLLLLRSCIFPETRENMCLSVKSNYSEVAFSTSQKFRFRLLGSCRQLLRSCVWAFFPPPLILCSPAYLFFLATFFLEIRLIGDGVSRVVQLFTVRRASNFICQTEGPVHVHH